MKTTLQHFLYSSAALFSLKLFGPQAMAADQVNPIVVVSIMLHIIRQKMMTALLYAGYG